MNRSNQDNPYSDYDAPKMEAYLKRHVKRENPSGEVYAYSNLGMGLLGYSMALAQKTNFSQLLQKEIFDVYQMKRSFVSPKGIGSELVKGLDVEGKEVPNWEFDALAGAGVVLSTAEDLVLFVRGQWQQSRTLLERTGKPSFTIDERMKIGWGWHILEQGTDRKKRWLWHNGATAGYTSCLVMDVEKQTAVIILSNVSGFGEEKDKIDQLCFTIMTESESATTEKDK